MPKGNTTREIPKAVRISLGDIGKILKKYNGEDCLDEKLSIPSKSFLMFERCQKPLYATIHLNPDEGATLNLYRIYLQLSRLDDYNQLLDSLGPDLQLFKHFYQTFKHNGLLFREFIKILSIHTIHSERRSEVRELNDFLV